MTDTTTANNATKTPAFTVSYTNAVHSPRSTLIPDRMDIDLTAQRELVAEHHNENLHRKLTTDLAATFCLKRTHERFLAMIISEVHRYHKVSSGTLLPRPTMAAVANGCADIMEKSDDDHYVAAIHYLGQLSMYSKRLHQVTTTTKTKTPGTSPQ